MTTTRLLKVLRNLLINTALVVMSLALTLLAGEGFVRTWLPSPDYGVGKRPAIRNQLFMYDELLGWKGSPNASSRYISKDFRITVTHDALGYRNLAPPFVAGKKNILLLGDSYGWGWGVEDDETAAAVLNRQHDEYNTYSLGVPGYGTDQQYLALQRLLTEHPEYHYDDVVVLFYLNDFADVSMNGNGVYPKPVYKLDSRGQLRLENVPVPRNNLPPVSITEEPDEQNLIQKSQLVNFAIDSISGFLFGLTASADPAANQPVSFSLNDEEKQSIILADTLLQKIRDICSEKNMRFQVVFLMTINTDEKPTAMIHSLAEKLQTSGIRYSFLESRKFPRTDLWLDTHYTPYGQARLAEHLAAVLDQQP